MQRADNMPTNPAATTNNEQKEQQEVPFGLHIGQMIKEYIEQNTNYTKTHVAAKLGLTRTCFSSRLSSNFYGNVHDLMKVSIFLEHDFVSPAVPIIRANGVVPNKTYTEKEFNEMQLRLAHAEKKLYEKERELNLTHELIEKYKMMS